MTTAWLNKLCVWTGLFIVFVVILGLNIHSSILMVQTEISQQLLDGLLWIWGFQQRKEPALFPYSAFILLKTNDSPISLCCTEN